MTYTPLLSGSVHKGAESKSYSVCSVVMERMEPGLSVLAAKGEARQSVITPHALRSSKPILEDGGIFASWKAR